MKNENTPRLPEAQNDQGGSGGRSSTPCSLRLFEISALVSYHAVILAESKEAALKKVETWENAWHDTGELVSVSDVDVFDVRAMNSKLEDWNDEAHSYTEAAGNAIRAAEELSSENETSPSVDATEIKP